MRSISYITKDEIAKNTEIKKIRKNWNKVFKQAVTNGDIPKKDMFEGMKNSCDDSEWL